MTHKDTHTTRSIKLASTHQLIKQPSGVRTPYFRLQLESLANQTGDVAIDQ